MQTASQLNRSQSRVANDSRDRPEWIGLFSKTHVVSRDVGG
jgi:hypothetical protein